MAQARSASRGTSDARGVIGASARVRGRISGDGHLLVEGQVEGDIAIRGDLVIADGASAASNVDAQSVTVQGTLEGDVTARGAVKIASGARVVGNMHGEHVSIDEGAQFKGRLDCEFELPDELRSAQASRKR
jgi:cytoskeletal protein CcmA (bactofilin family)